MKQKNSAYFFIQHQAHSKWFTAFVFLILFLGINHSAHAFSKIGHKLVCEVAYQTLSKKSQAKIDNILQLIPDDHKTLINRYARVRKTDDVSFTNACLWADAIKGSKTFASQYKQFKPWHYINVARDDLKVTKTSCKENCVTQAIAVHTKQLQQRKITWEKTQALMFLGHWVADVHQPMHVSFKDDLGGNKLKIKWLASSANLSEDKRIINCKSMHALWDDCLFRQWDKTIRDRKLFKTHLAAIMQEIKELPIEKLASIKQGDQWLWATESLTLVRNPAVKYCHLQHNSNMCLPFQVRTMYLMPEYHQKFSAIALERVMFAGIRLAELLKKSL